MQKKTQQSSVKKNSQKAVIAIVMGSDSDWPVMQKAKEALDLFNLSCQVKIVSAHRTPKRLFDFATKAKSQGLQLIIAGAGGAAHLPGMIASLTVLPVIGVPVSATQLKGQDSLLSIVQMPAGIPVATVAIDNAYNAGLLAAQILATADSKLSQKIQNYRKKLSQTVLKKDKKLKELL